jgi:hypothetical protein
MVRDASTHPTHAYKETGSAIRSKSSPTYSKVSCYINAREDAASLADMGHIGFVERLDESQWLEPIVRDGHQGTLWF